MSWEVVVFFLRVLTLRANMALWENNPSVFSIGAALSKLSPSDWTGWWSLLRGAECYSINWKKNKSNCANVPTGDFKYSQFFVLNWLALASQHFTFPLIHLSQGLDAGLKYNKKKVLQFQIGTIYSCAFYLIYIHSFQPRKRKLFYSI